MMLRLRVLTIGALAMLGIAVPAEAGWRVGIGINFPVFCGPYYGPYYRPYYYPPPVYVVQPAPVVVPAVPVTQAAPATQPAYESGAPPVAAAPAPVPVPASTAPTTIQPARLNQRQLEIENSLRQLSDSNERTRADAVMQLGRLKAQDSLDALSATLAGDPSPNVREAAARALGLLGSPKALPALRHAALADSDNNVRHSAQFATEVVQATSTGR
jgi:hypothetical protein